MASAPRTPESVAQDIQREREQLALAVSHLRSELKAATDVKAMLRSKWPQLSAVATIAVGALAFRAVLKRHGRRETTRARFGRFAVVERD
jgi:hypothetical protein